MVAHGGPIQKLTKQKGLRGMAQMGKHLASKHKALSLNPLLQKKKKTYIHTYIFTTY
jgi:hypothetical protein